MSPANDRGEKEEMRPEYDLRGGVRGKYYKQYMEGTNVVLLDGRKRDKGAISMGKSRDTYKYHFKVGNKIVHGGITNDLERREQEHQQQWPKGHIVQVGKRTTEEAARKWEEEKAFT